jgi:peptidoglycan/LPS O-acetylase OafA/YrhL
MTRPSSLEETKQPAPSLAAREFRESVNLDILRSVAVLLIFSCHYLACSAHSSAKWAAPWRFGQIGLWMFFVHTCVVLMWSLERIVRRESNYLVPFYVRRLMRIYPLSIFFVLLAYVFDTRWVPGGFWRTLTLTQNLTLHHVQLAPPMVVTMWTLPMQVDISLALPIFLVFRKRSVAWVWFLWAASIPLVWLQPRLPDIFGILEFLPCFIAGVIVWRSMRDHVPQRLPAWLWPVSLAALSFVAIFENPFTMPFCTAGFGAALALLLPHVSEIQSRTVATAARIVARYSFSIYLVHYPILLYVVATPGTNFQGIKYVSPVLFRYIPPMPIILHFARPVHLILTAILTAGASYVLYHCIEKPGIDLGHNLVKKLARRPSNPEPLVEVAS